MLRWIQTIALACAALVLLAGWWRHRWRHRRRIGRHRVTPLLPRRRPASPASAAASGAPAPDIVQKAPVQHVKVGDLDVGYRTIGPFGAAAGSTPLLMIMGSSGTMDEWSPRFVEALAQGREVVVFDNRGMGETDDPGGAYRVLAARRRHRRAHQGARLRQDGRPRVVDGRRRGHRPGRAASAGREPARQLRRRRRRSARRPDEQEDAGRADRHVGHGRAARHAAAHAAVPGVVSQGRPGLRRELPRSRPSRPRPRRSRCRTRRSASGRASGAASRASRRRRCSSPAPRT